MKFSKIDLSDIYTENLGDEVNEYRQLVSTFINQIFIKHFISSGLLELMTYQELTNPDTHPSLTACYFTKKIIDHFIDRGNLTIAENDFLQINQPINGDDPEDKKLDEFLSQYPEKKVFYEILRSIREVMEAVLFQGEDALSSMVNDNSQKALKLWEELMMNNRIKHPCHQLVIRALKEKAALGAPLRIFEGGAGIASVLRAGLTESGFIDVFKSIDKYFFTDPSSKLIKLGRESLLQQMPKAFFEKIEFKVADLNKLFLNGTAFTRDSSIDLIILEHSLVDVIDLQATLDLFYKIMKPGGYLIFTVAFRSRPKDFFPFEYLQTIFQKYTKTKLETGYRENMGYLTIAEWENSLKRSGFESFEIYPSKEDQVRWPYGGILAMPSK